MNNTKQAIFAALKAQFSAGENPLPLNTQTKTSTAENDHANKNDIQKTLWQKALQYLKIREQSRHELEQKLSSLLKRSADQNILTAVLDELAEKSYQSDTRFIELLIRSKMQKGYGPRTIIQILKQHNIQEKNILSHIAAETWQELIKSVQKKRFNKLPQSASELGKQQRFLLSRGFEPSLINWVLKTTSDD